MNTNNRARAALTRAVNNAIANGAPVYTEQPAQPDEREQILTALAAWIAQRPGLEYGNYGDPKSYRAELRSITKDLHQARTLLSAVRWRTSIGADELKAAFHGAFSGRLSWLEDKAATRASEKYGRGGRYGKLEYCTGQYWPTEYRRAVCAVLASALWDYARANLPDGEIVGGVSRGDRLRNGFRKEFGRAIASRWFN